MMSRIARVWSCWLGFAGLAAAGAVEFPRGENEAARVVIVANRNEPESVQLARYYADRREIPRDNIVALDLPAGEEVDWPQFLSRLYTPLQTWLIDEGWLEAIPMDLVDDVGRRKMSTAGHRISYLVTCRGVPLKIRQSKDIPPDGAASLTKNLRTHRAAVDSELALINQSAPVRDGYVRNPLFGKPDPGLFDGDQVVRVARLDGPSFPAARHLVESALEAEQYGLMGRAVVDIGGPHQRGDQWFEEAVGILEGMGWAPMVDRNRATLPVTARADGVAIYLGWYAGKINGPFMLPGYQFAPGAIALHLHSFSARSLRLPDGGGWTGPLVARGVAATVGNVYEPYLEFTHHPHMLIGALLSGATWGEAAYFAMPALSWQGVVMGDPLYRPTTTSALARWEAGEFLPVRWGSYALAGRLARDAAAVEEVPPAMVESARAAFAQFPSLALAWEVAQLRARTGDVPGAVAELGMAGFVRRPRPDEWGLMARMAEQLTAWEDGAGAAKVWSVLMAQPLPDAARKAWLPPAIDAARVAGDFTVVVEWERALRRLQPPAEG